MLAYIPLIPGEYIHNIFRPEVIYIKLPDNSYLLTNYTDYYEQMYEVPITHKDSVYMITANEVLLLAGRVKDEKIREQLKILLKGML